MKKGVLFVFLFMIGFSQASELLASENFESGNWNGGSGNWNGAWYHGGDAKIYSELSEISNVDFNEGNEFLEGIYSLRLRRGNGYAERMVLLENYSNISVSFYARVLSFEGNDFANILVSSNGQNWNVLQNFSPINSDGLYHKYELDLSSLEIGDSFYLAFDSEMNNINDQLFIDGIVIQSNVPSIVNDSNISIIPTWHIQFNPIPSSPAADVQYWNLDLFDVPAEAMQSLKSQGVYVMCYFSAGSWENWRADAAEFPSECLGNNNGWPGEKWLDTRCEEVREIMLDRIDFGIAKGCDGFDPDNMDAYSNNPGFPITEQDGVDYYNFLADYAHSQGKGMGLKNALTIIDDVLPNMDWAINEQCYQYNECYYLDQVVEAGKPVFQLEYGGAQKADEVCAQSNFKRYSTLVKNQGLDEFEIACWEWAEVNICGNGVVEGLEVCDDGALNGETGFCNLECDGIIQSEYLLAGDDFESGNWNGGVGSWNGAWYHEGGGNAQILSGISPQNGSYHLMLKRGNGYVDRSADLSEQENVRLSFYARVEGFEGSDYATVSVGPEGTTLSNLKTFVVNDSDGIYKHYEFDLSSYDLTNSFYVAIDAQMNQDNDRIFIDDLRFYSY